MRFHFTQPVFLWLLVPALAWVFWLARHSDVQIGAWRRWTALVLRTVVVVLVVFALAGLQRMKPQEGMNVFFLLDRSESIPPAQQEAALDYINRVAEGKKSEDQAGVLVFGIDAGIETMPNVKLVLPKVQAVVGTERTDIGAAIRLGTAAFPETGQKRLVLLSDGNENMGDALAALRSARALNVTVDVVPMGIRRGGDTSVQKMTVPSQLKEGQTFEAKIFVEADRPGPATVRLYRNEQYLGEQQVDLDAGKNLFTFPQNLEEPGFYSYDVRVEREDDTLPQNNRAIAFASVRGEPRVLVVSSAPDQDGTLVAALQSTGLEVALVDANRFPATLAEMQSYDAIFLCNVAAGDLGRDSQKLLESAVRDFGVGFVCVGGDQTYAAGGYRGTPLEDTLPLNMELDSKKVLPKGAVALVMHGMEFMNGNQVARDCAIGVLEALGPRDEMGVVLWDGTERWLFPMTEVGNKAALGRQIAGMNQGDLPAFEGVMRMAYEGLKKSTANLKHMIVFSDGDPQRPSQPLMNSITGDRITVSTVLIAGHAGPDNMIYIAEQGNGRFYNVTSPADLPQIFIKEAAVILKSAIYEEPFRPQVVSASELIRGIAPDAYPQLLGYVATTPKARAETPMLTDKGDPLLAHWQYGLGRSVAFTSDAKARWARDWLGWGQYRQFWTQIAQWSLRRLENADFTTEVSVEKGVGQISVEALDENGNYRNFLNLQTVVVSPEGERQTVRLEQTGPGHYEATFPTKEVGAYLLNLMEVQDGQLRGSQVVGASVNYSPEFTEPEPNLSLLRRLAEEGGGQVLSPTNPADNSFRLGRKETYQPRDLWEWLLRAAVILFTVDVGVRRIQLDPDELRRAWLWVRRKVFFWQGVPRPQESEESLAALLTKREQVRSRHTGPVVAPKADLFQPKEAPVQPASAVSAKPEEPASLEAAPSPEQPSPDAIERPASTASRLLEAKRRAQRRRK